MFWQKIVISGESGRNLVILHDSTENCSLARFWQKEWLSCNNLAKNGYSVRFWWKRLSCNVLAKKCHFGGIREKFGYPARFDRKLFSCKILAEWMVILQYADKNGYLGRLWQKEWLSCNNLAKNSYSVRFWWKRLSCNVLAKNCHFGRIREKFGYPARFDRKLFSCKILTERMAILQ